MGANQTQKKKKKRQRLYLKRVKARDKTAKAEGQKKK